MVDEPFPVSEYYRACVVDGKTLTRVGGWWTAILLLKDPRTDKPFVAMYRWQKSADGWKVRKRFSFKTAREIKEVIEIISRYSEKVE